jgi:DNA-binding beta-propeller fold protein YncE
VGDDQQTNTHLGAYLLGDVLGRGGMGVVYRATHVHLGREVALKVLAPELSSQPEFRERFLRESRLAASLDHPNVVTVYDAGDFEGTLYIAMRYVDGTDLAKLLRQGGRLTPGTTLGMLQQVGAGLDAAHRLGLIHRDVKPGNVLITWLHCYLTDFGLTKRATAGGASEALTRTGQFLGTVDYVAPEQIEGRGIDARTDVYALTCMLHECLTGFRPFQKDSEVAVIFAHLHDPPPRPTEVRPELPAPINDVVATGMAKSPEDRYSTCSELIDDARAALTGLGAAPTPIAGSTRRGQARPRGDPRQSVAATVASNTVGHDAPTRPSFGGRRPRMRVLIPALAVLAAAAIAVAVVLVTAGGRAKSKQVAQGARVVGSPIVVGKAPIGIAGNASVLWVANFDASTVTRVSKNGAIRTDIPVAPGPFGVFFYTGDTFWVSSANAGVVTPIAVATGLPGKPIHVGRHPESITGDEDSLFVTNAFDGTVSAIDPRADTLIGTPIRVGRFPQGIAYSGTAVWVADSDDDNVDRIVDGRVIKTIPVGRNPTGVAVGDNAVWVANNGDNTVSRIDLGQGDEVKTIRVSRGPFAIAFGLGSAWVTNRGDNTVTRLNASTGEPVGDPIAVGQDPTGIAVIGDAVWVTNRGSGTVQQIQP